MSETLHLKIKIVGAGNRDGAEAFVRGLVDNARGHGIELGALIAHVGHEIIDVLAPPRIVEIEPEREIEVSEADVGSISAVPAP